MNCPPDEYSLEAMENELAGMSLSASASDGQDHLTCEGEALHRTFRILDDRGKPLAQLADKKRIASTSPA